MPIHREVGASEGAASRQDRESKDALELLELKVALGCGKPIVSVLIPLHHALRTPVRVVSGPVVSVQTLRRPEGDSRAVVLSPGTRSSFVGKRRVGKRRRR